MLCVVRCLTLVVVCCCWSVWFEFVLVFGVCYFSLLCLVVVDCNSLLFVVCYLSVVVIRVSVVVVYYCLVFVVACCLVLIGVD